jgi:predicted nucleic acid-binding protein
MGKKKPQPASPAFVLDCSVTLAWYFEDEAEAYADTVQEALAKAPAIVPSLWALEVANVLLIGERRQRTTEARASQFITLLKSLPIHIDEGGAEHVWTDVLRLGRTHGLSTYDAAYLELALRAGLPLASLDGPLKTAALAAGVAGYRP